jgi:sugar (pentulose or hexulose) kinase
VTANGTPLLLGIDVGTSACKAAVVGADGGEIVHGQTPTPWDGVPSGGQVDPDALADAAIAAARDALAQLPPHAHVTAIGVASIAETGVLLDADDTILHPAVAWHDARGAEAARAIARDLPDFVERTGLPPSPLCSLAKLRHLSLRGAARWLNVAEWVVCRLGGRDVSELSLASRTGLLDLSRAAPYAEALEWAGLPRDLLGDLVPAGFNAGTHDGTALPQARGAALTVAGHDHLVAGVGVGVVAPGDVLDSCGTAEALVRVVAPPLDAPAVRRSVEGGASVGWHVTEGRQALLGSAWSGLALSEVLAALGVDDAGREELDAGALAIAPGEAPALELELHSLSRRPLELPDAPPAGVWRAAIDAVANEIEAVVAHIDAVAGPHTRIVVTGGWSRDPAVMNAKRGLGAVEAPPVVEAGCRGAALLAGVAAGLYAGPGELPAVQQGAKEPA